MAFANAPPIFALSGRNGIVSLFTGIEPQHLRFVHKTFGYVMLVLTFIHFMGATFFVRPFSGPHFAVADTTRHRASHGREEPAWPHFSSSR